MKNPEHLKYTETHEWVASEADGTLSVGITDHAQEVLGDMVFLELPQIGKRYAQGEACAVIESVKAASDINMPVAGAVVAVNEELAKSPEKINADAYAAWLFKIKPDDSGDVGGLMDAAAYAGHAAK
ncbi:MAG: glycine cleavage system protein GcvH [Betaproteobacteria bacterium]|nr:MAG: glycine cleavage system protein GcvH [Betaproteobacteria bacterium]